MDFLDIPEEVIVGNICSYLNYNDVLRLRHVNKQIKGYADMHLELRVANHELEINGADKNLEKFMTLGVCATRVYFNIFNFRYFKNNEPDIKKFLEKYGGKITHLRVFDFHAFSVEGEMDFYGTLSNLKHLEIDHMFPFGTRKGENQFPNNFKQLETLKFGIVYWKENTDEKIPWDFFNFCEKLVHFKLGSPSEGNWGDFDYDVPFSNISNAIRERKIKFPNGPHLKYYDISGIDFHIDNAVSEPRLINLVEVCAQHDVKLIIDTTEDDFLDRTVLYARNHPALNLGKSIMTMQIRHIGRDIFLVEMPNLENISIDFASLCHVDDDLDCNPDWPKLKKLDVNVSYINKHSDVLQLFKYLFEREEPRREQLTELRLDFWEVNSFPYPEAGSIIATCPNLTKLTLCNYPDSAPNTEYSKLWKGLKLLQELCLDQCPTLGDAGFIGSNVEKPAFLELKCLKKLTLKPLEKMPKITDYFFKTVLRHVKLSHLTIESYRPITSISEEGIRSLLSGEFGKSIEKFPFEEWSLEGVNKKEFKLLGSKFRSTYMI